MKNLNYVLRVFFILFFILSVNMFSQDSLKAIVLSENIGSMVDKQERDLYNLMPGLKEKFISAIYYLDADSLFKCRVRLSDGDKYRDSIIFLNYSSIRNTAYRIQYLENTSMGLPFLALEDIKLSYADNQKVEKIENYLQENQKTSKVVDRQQNRFLQNSKPFQKPLPLKQKPEIDYPNIIDKKNNLGVSVGLLYNSSSYEGVSEIFNLLEENIPQPGFKIQKSNLTFNSSPIIKLSSFFIIKEKWMLEVAYGFNLHLNTDQYLSYENFTTSIGYLIPLKNSIDTYVSVGFSSTEFGAFKEYNVYVDSSQGMLKSIILNGNSKGLIASLGFKIKISSLVSIDIKGSYILYPKTNIKNPGYIDIPPAPRVNLNGFDIGISLCFMNN